jgi:hypothetical protein
MPVTRTASASTAAQRTWSANLTDGRGYPVLTWPQLFPWALGQVEKVDEVLPVPPAPPTVEELVAALGERVAVLEREVAELRGE